MEFIVPTPQRKNEPPFSASLPSSEFPLKDFKLLLSSWSVSAQHSISNLVETHFKPHILLPTKKKQTPTHFSNCSALTFNFFKKCLAHPYLKEGDSDYALYITVYKRENKFTTILYDRFLIYRTAKSLHL